MNNYMLRKQIRRALEFSFRPEEVEEIEKALDEIVPPETHIKLVGAHGFWTFVARPDLILGDRGPQLPDLHVFRNFPHRHVEHGHVNIRAVLQFDLNGNPFYLEDY